MPFIGQQPTTGAFIQLDSLTASATANYTLQLNGANFEPESVNNLLVSINGIIQGSNTMSLSGSTLTVGATLSNSDVIDFVRVFGNVGTISTPTDGSVTASKIGSNAVDLTTKVTGVLPVANGGTGISSGLGLIIKRTVIAGATGTVNSTSSYQTIKTYSFTPQSDTVSMLVFFKVTASHRASGRGFHRLKYDGDILATQYTFDTGTNTQFTSTDQDVFISTITLPKSGTLNFTYEGANTSSPAVGIGNNSTLTIVELGI